MGSPIQQELPGGKTSTELPLATSVQTCCSVHSNRGQSNHQTRSESTKEPQLLEAATMSPPNSDHCSGIKSEPN